MHQSLIAALALLLLAGSATADVQAPASQRFAAATNETPDFQRHPSVINGFSELMAQVFGQDNGVGARSAVGMGSLPGNIAVEVEVICALKS